MPGKPKPKPIEAFVDNFADAKELLEFADALTNTRKRKMRRELRERVGESLKVNKGDWDSLDCIQSPEVFVVLMPGSRFSRDQFRHQEAMLRQAIVSGCTALETYIADKAIEQVRGVIGVRSRKDPIPPSLAALKLRLDTWDKIDRFKRSRRAITDHFIKSEIGQRASTHPDKVRDLLKMTDLKDPLESVDDRRGVARGATYDQLDAINKRRNNIAHTGDRDGRGRATISPGTVREYLDHIEDIAHAIEECY